MLPLTDIKKIYFLGIGGIGMSALARYFCRRGVSVWGYDKTPSPLTTQLQQEGMNIHFEDNPSLIPQDIDMVVYTPAVPHSLVEWKHIQAMGLPCIKRSQMLGFISADKETYAIAGTHGKTSTTAMLTQILHGNRLISAFIGGIANNFNSNYVDDAQSSILVVEADEYDRSFLTLNPYVAIVTAIDADHLDIYGTKDKLEQSFQDFVEKIPRNGYLITKKTLLKALKPHCNVVTYSLNDNTCDYFAQHLRVENNKQCFDIVCPQNRSVAVAFSVAGTHNIENAVAATAAADICGVDVCKIAQNLNQYLGVKRRFEYIINRPDFVYIDDYAHHPKELEATIMSVKHLYPNKKICGVFQPHLYTRTRDFADGFAQALDLLDNIVLLEIYPAREEPIEGIDAQFLLNKIKNPNKIRVSKENLPDFLTTQHLEVLITMGAGDIDRLVPKIKEKFNNE